MLKYLDEFKKSGRLRLYKCECSYCSNIVYVRKGRIKTQNSCGCKRSNNLDLKNKKINYITYTGEKTRNKYKTILYHGICDCGNEVWSDCSDYATKIACGCSLSYLNRPKNFIGKKGKYIHHAFFKKCKSGAKTRKINFDLTPEDLDDQFEKQNGLCYYSGEKLLLCDNAVDYQRDRSLYNISVDRLDSNKGYHKDNICLCLKEINYMKRCLTEDRFIELCKKISDFN